MIRVAIDNNVKGAQPFKFVSRLGGLIKKVFGNIRLGSWKFDGAGSQKAQNHIDNVEEFIQRSAYDAATHALSELRDATPVRTGKTRDGWSMQSYDTGKETTYQINHDDPAAIDRINFGTKPHVIMAKNKKALHFFIGGKEIFAKLVNHPGTAGSGFVDKARVSLTAKLKALQAARELA